MSSFVGLSWYVREELINKNIQKLQKVPPLVTKIFFVMNICNMGIIGSGLVSRLQNCWNFCSGMFKALEIMGKTANWPDSAHRPFFGSFLMISQAVETLE